MLASVVAWVSHLGARVPAAGRVLAGGADPLRQRAGGLCEVAAANAAPALAFVVQHSLLRSALLARLGLGAHAQLAYCVLSALALHWFIAGFVPHDSPVVLELPLPPLLHAALSLSALAAAFAALLAERRTYELLGVPQALAAWGDRRARAEPGMAGMDIITWQGLQVYRRGALLGGPGAGAAAFVAFSGLSILPAKVTASDLIVRVVAALYLRQRSRAFRSWVDRIEGVHILSWLLRLLLVLAALQHSSAQFRALVLTAGVLGTLALHRAERRAGPGADATASAGPGAEAGGRAAAEGAAAAVAGKAAAEAAASTDAADATTEKKRSRPGRLMSCAPTA